MSTYFFWVVSGPKFFFGWIFLRFLDGFGPRVAFFGRFRLVFWLISGSCLWFGGWWVFAFKWALSLVSS